MTHARQAAERITCECCNQIVGPAKLLETSDGLWLCEECLLAPAIRSRDEAREAAQFFYDNYKIHGSLARWPWLKEATT